MAKRNYYLLATVANKKKCLPLTQVDVSDDGKCDHFILFSDTFHWMQDKTIIKTNKEFKAKCCSNISYKTHIQSTDVWRFSNWNSQPIYFGFVALFFFFLGHRLINIRQSFRIENCQYLNKIFYSVYIKLEIWYNIISYMYNVYVCM